jgi:two-component system sensor histidine kinase QseC
VTSLRARLTAATIAVVGVGLAIGGWVLYGAVDRSVRDEFDRALLARARAIGNLVEFEHDDGFEVEADAAMGTFQIWAPDGSVLARSGPELPRSSGPPDRPQYGNRDGARLVGVDVGARIESNGPPPGPVTIVVAADAGSMEATLADVRRWFYVIGGATVALLAIACALLVRRSLAPLARVARQIAEIDERRLDTRLADDSLPDELRVPVAKLDELLAKLDASFARERRFTADASHELRTPLAGLRTLLDVTMQRERSGDEYRRALVDARGIVDQLAHLVQNLLLLARLDAGQIAVVRTPVALRGLIDECWRPHAETAAARNLRFVNQVSDDAIATTDLDLLRVVVGNLVGNAAEYTESGGEIVVTAPDGSIVDVRDSGPTLPPEHLARMFDRMWRADDARSGAHCGIGLGLSRELCKVLGFDLVATTPDDGGLRMTVTA